MYQYRSMQSADWLLCEQWTFEDRGPWRDLAQHLPWMRGQPYLAVINEESKLCGLACFQRLAQVPGGHYPNEKQILDFGFIRQPEDCYRGSGSDFVSNLMIYASLCFQCQHFRASVNAENHAAIRVLSKVGFEKTDRFLSIGSPLSKAYFIMEQYCVKTLR